MNDFYAPMTKEEAWRRIEESERDIAEGRVIPHEEVMRQTYELLKKYGCGVEHQDGSGAFFG